MNDSFTDDKKIAIANWNSLRKANKGKWIAHHAVIEGKPFAIKSYNTWIQRCVWGSVVNGGPMDCSVKQANDWIAKFLEVGK